MLEAFKKELYFEQYLGGMTIIKLTESCYVQPEAILIIQADLALAGSAPATMRAEWEASPERPSEGPYRMLMPAIKVVLVGERDVMIHFANSEARNAGLASLVKQWKGE